LWSTADTRRWLRRGRAIERRQPTTRRNLNGHVANNDNDCKRRHGEGKPDDGGLSAGHV